MEGDFLDVTQAIEDLVIVVSTEMATLSGTVEGLDPQRPPGSIVVERLEAERGRRRRKQIGRAWGVVCRRGTRRVSTAWRLCGQGDTEFMRWKAWGPMSCGKWVAAEGGAFGAGD